MSGVPDARRLFEHEGKHYEVWSVAGPGGAAFAIFEDGQQITVPKVADRSVSSAADPKSVEAMMDMISEMFRRGLLVRLPRKSRDNS